MSAGECLDAWFEHVDMARCESKRTDTTPSAFTRWCRGCAACRARRKALCDKGWLWGGVQKRTHFCVMTRGASQWRWRDVLHSFYHRCDCGTWASVKVLDCTGTTVEAHGLQGLDVDFTGSHFGRSMVRIECDVRNIISRSPDLSDQSGSARDEDDTASVHIIFRFAFAVVSKTSGFAVLYDPAPERIFVLATYLDWKNVEAH